MDNPTVSDTRTAYTPATHTHTVTDISGTTTYTHTHTVTDVGGALATSQTIAVGAGLAITTGTSTDTATSGALGDTVKITATVPPTHTHTVTDVSGAVASTHTHAGTLVTQWTNEPTGGASIATGTAWTTIASDNFANTGSQIVIDADAQFAVNADTQECLLAIFVGGTQYGVYGYVGGPKIGSSYSIKSAHTRALVNTTATSVSVAVSGKVGAGAGACTVPSGANTVQVHYQMFR